MAAFTTLPHPFDPVLGREAAACVPDLSDDLAALVAGAGGSSPYLSGLIRKEAGWLPEALDAPEAALGALHHGLSELPPDQVKTGLRQAKRRVALLVALMDLGGVWTLEQVTGALTDFADAATRTALRTALEPVLKRGKIPGLGPDAADSGAGLVALAMGKMGAHELNYSSDIDLICLLDETQFARADFIEARAGLIKATRQMCVLLSDNTAEGYVFRTDLRLRPDPSVTPVVVAMAAAERYYESLGRTWERAAFIKARPAAGDLDAGARFLRDLTPFVWRRHLDFAAIEDAHNMRLAIRAHKGTGGAITLPGHDMKLGRGGIREIEFFTQTQQLITGGRDPDLRVRGTVAGLERLVQAGWVPEGIATSFIDHYRFHRTIEHRLQMVHDAQTHALPQTPRGFARLAALCGRDQAGLEHEIAERLAEVHDAIETFFAPEGRSQPFATSEPASDFGEEIASRWPGYPALRSNRAAQIFKRLEPEILEKLGKTAHPDDALRAFDGFLAGLPAGVQVFSLFEANPPLVDLIVDIAGTAPGLARYLSRNASVFDAVIGGGFWSDWPGSEELARDLAGTLSQEDDYEQKLDAARRWAKEWHFRIGVHYLRGLAHDRATGRAYADLADACLTALWPVVVRQFARKHGPPPGRGAVILGMGSLGAQRLTAASDLDLIVIYDAQDAESSDGPRPLQVRPYFARLTKALVTALSAPMAEGRLYEVDMRLRPSGTQGPVATSWRSFETYQRDEAWVWEHLALTRARVVTGDAGLGSDVENLRCALLAGRGAADVWPEVAEMRARIAAAKMPEGLLDAKIGPGRMQDIELVAQAQALIAGASARDTLEQLQAGEIQAGESADSVRVLTAAYDLQARLQMATRLLTDKVPDSETLTNGPAALVFRETDVTDIAALEGRLTDLRAQAASAIAAMIGATPGETP